MRSHSYRSGNEVIVPLRWNTPHKRGGKQSGDIDWSIISKPRPSSTQEALKRSQHDALSNDTRFGVTAECNSLALSSVSDKPYGEPLQRDSIRRGEQVQITMATEVAVQVLDISKSYLQFISLLMYCTIYDDLLPPSSIGC